MLVLIDGIGVVDGETKEVDGEGGVVLFEVTPLVFPPHDTNVEALSVNKLKINSNFFCFMIVNFNLSLIIFSVVNLKAYN